MNLSIKNVPDDVVRLLKKRALANHRSLQGELRAIVEDVARTGRALEAEANDEIVQMLREDRDRDFVVEPRTRRILSIGEARAHMRTLGVKTAGDSTEIIRRSRDER